MLYKNRVISVNIEPAKVHYATRSIMRKFLHSYILVIISLTSTSMSAAVCIFLQCIGTISWQILIKVSTPGFFIRLKFPTIPSLSAQHTNSQHKAANYLNLRLSDMFSIDHVRSTATSAVEFQSKYLSSLIYSSVCFGF